MPNSATIFAWNKYSKSSAFLVDGLTKLGVKTRKTSLQTWPGVSPSTKYNLVNADVSISWGAKLPAFLLDKSKKPLNQMSYLYSDKLYFFKWATEVGLDNWIPKFTTDMHEVEYKLATGTSPWIARLTTKAYGGKGIVLLDPTAPALDIPNAPLYTKYIKKSSEYRVHFVKSGLDIRYYYQKKKRIKDAPTSVMTFKVRNLSNGWVYSSINFEMPLYVKDAAAKFAKKIPLDFGALDIIYNEHESCAYCLEVNTAPGLIQQTAAWYANCFKEMF